VRHDDDPRKPLTLFEGAERIGVFPTELELFSAIEPPDIDNYTVVDNRGSAFKIRFQRPTPSGLLDKLADTLGAPVAMTLVPQGTKHDS
jgi:hypothetical protein